MSELMIVRINFERVRKNLSEGYGWRRNATIPEDKVREHLREMGFEPNPDGETWTARSEDLLVLRPSELEAAEPAPRGHRMPAGEED